MTLANAARRLNAGSVPALMLVTDEMRLPDPLAAAETVPAGTAVLLRHYGDPDREGLAARMAAAARRRRLVLVVAADWRLAARVRAGGVHLPEHLARSGRLAPLLGWARRRGALVTAACHSRGMLAAAGRLGVDAAILSPAFPTLSHPGATAIGAVRFRLWVRDAAIPAIALGGVTANTARALAGSAAGLAAIGGWTK